jgi:hypothetical protein
MIGILDTQLQRIGESGSLHLNQWYGFGRAEEVYYRVEGMPATTAPYSVVLNTSTVVPVELGSTLFEGNITISTVGVSNSTDSDMWLYDAGLVPLTFGGNDDQLNPPVPQSRLVRSLTPGTYYLAISDSNLANNYASPPDDGNPTENVFDFPDVVADSTEQINVPLGFSISDIYGHLTVTPATKTEPFEILWYRFVVLPHPYTGHTFCEGDGHPGSQPCPCSNFGAPDHGCAGFPNISGAFLDWTGTPSLQLDSVLLRCGDLPPNSVSLFFQGSVLVNAGYGTPFQDGLLCAGGTQVRLGVKHVDSFGEAVFGYQQPGDPTLHVAGGILPPGGSFAYQVWYRNTLGACGSGSNTSNGLVLNWGQ